MSEPNERDKALADLLGIYGELRTIAAYREECVKAERERIRLAVVTAMAEAMLLVGPATVADASWLSEVVERALGEP